MIKKKLSATNSADTATNTERFHQHQGRPKGSKNKSTTHPTRHASISQVVHEKKDTIANLGADPSLEGT